MTRSEQNYRKVARPSVSTQDALEALKTLCRKIATTVKEVALQ